MEEVANRSRLFTKKALPGLIVAPFWLRRAACGTLGLLFELLFVTLGRYWGPLGPKLQKDSKIDEKSKPEGKPF